MKSQYSTIFLLLDLGHPMENGTVKIIKESLNNVLTLASACFDKSNEFIFGIVVMNSDFTLICSSTNLRKNYRLVTKKLDALDKNMINQKSTLQEYKNVLRTSLQNILKLELNFKKINRGENVFSDQLKELQIQITVITTKTVSILADILVDVTNKLFTQEYQNSFSSVKNLKIVQILNEHKINPETQLKRKISIDWVTCPHRIQDLCWIFKDWLLKPIYEQEQLHIKLSKDTDLTIKCDVGGCIAEPTFSAIKQKFDLRTDFEYEISNNISPLDISKRANDLQVLYRIPLSRLYPKLIFGIPRRIYATCSHTLNWNETQINLQIFNELCRELAQTEQGLLTKFTLFYEANELSFYYFIAPDGNTLMLYRIAPEELHLPRRSEFLKAHFQVDEKVTSTVRDSLLRIHVLEEYSPLHFSSGLYEFLQKYMIKTAHAQNLCRCHNTDLEPSVRKRKLTMKTLATCTDVKFHTATKNFNAEPVKTGSHKISSGKSRDKKFLGKTRQKHGNELKNNIHPALLPPETAEKYRKVNPSAFNLPELGESYNTNLY